MFPVSPTRPPPLRPGQLTAVRRFSLEQVGEVLRKLGMPFDAAKAQDLHARHGDTFQKLLQDKNAPLALKDDGAGGTTVEPRAKAPGDATEPELPTGFAALARELAEAAPAQSLRLLEAALNCTAKPDVLAEVAQVHAKAALACMPVQTTPTAAVITTTTDTARSNQTSATTNTTTTTTTETSTTTTPTPTLSLQAQTVHDVNLTGKQQLALAIDGGLLEDVENLLASGQYLLNEVLEDGDTALQRAALKGQLGIVNHLLAQKGIQPSQADAAGMTPLHHAAQAGHVDIVLALLNKGAALDPVAFEKNETPLHLALMGKHEAVVRALVDRNANIHAKTTPGSTPFYLAIRSGLLDMAKLLRAKGADIEQETNNGWSPLLIACKGHTPETVRWLLAQGTDVSRRGPYAFNVLHVAAWNTAHPGVLDVLIERIPPGQFQALANQPDAWDTKAVGRAAECGQSEAFINKLQLTQVAPPLLKPVATNYARCWVVTGVRFDARDSRKTVEIGRQGGIHMQAYGTGEFDLSWREFKALDIQDGDMVTLKCHSAWSEILQMQMVTFGGDEQVPLTDAVVHLFGKRVLRMLITGCGVAKAMSRLKNRFQLDPGIRRPADQHGGYKGLSITMVGAEGVSLIPLNQTAVELWTQDAATKLLHGVEGRTLQQRGVQPMRTLLADATQKTLVIQERAALTAEHLTGLDPDEAAKIKSQLLFMHVCENHLAQVQALVNVHKADPLGKDERGCTPLLVACELGHLDLARFFLAHTGADIHERSSQGATPLWLASGFNHLGLVEFLLKKGAKVDAADNEGFTPLCAASRRGNLAVVKLLLKAGANRHVVVRGATPAEAALDHGHYRVAELLKR